MRKRSWQFFCVLVVLFSGLLGRIFYIIQSQPAQVVSSQSAWTITAATTRGTIYDTKLRPLTNEKKQYYAVVFPQDTALDTLREQVDTATFQHVRDQISQGQPAKLTLTKPIAVTDSLHMFCLPNRYGNAVLAPHIIGYLDHTQQHGVCGIEQSCDTVLRKYNGTAEVTYYSDAHGKRLTDVPVDILDSTSNSNGGVVLTLDKDIQGVVESVAEQYITKGAVVVMDPYTGDIKASASYPTFQPHTVSKSVAQNDGALLNRALSLYDCGSVFKIITAAAALEEGIPVTHEYLCPGYTEVGGVRFHCHNRTGHGMLDMTQAMAQSCNVYFIELAREIGAKTLYEMSVRFGFDRNISITEHMQTAQPLLPSLSSLESSPAALANLAFGQGYLMTTPLHIARITSTIARNGTIPGVRLIGGFIDENGVVTDTPTPEGTTILSLETVYALQRMLRQVVTEGTGKGAAPDRVTAAGKTGTAQTGQNGEIHPVVNQWFTGYFPADNPQYVITVLAEDADNTNGNASKVFCEIINTLTGDREENTATAGREPR